MFYSKYCKKCGQLFKRSVMKTVTTYYPQIWFWNAHDIEIDYYCINCWPKYDEVGFNYGKKVRKFEVDDKGEPIGYERKPKTP